MASADVARAKAKAAIAINLIMFLSHSCQCALFTEAISLGCGFLRRSAR